jgi:hypothetical protein
LSIALQCMVGEHFGGPNIIVILANWKKWWNKLISLVTILDCHIRKHFTNFRAHLTLSFFWSKISQCGIHLAVIRLSVTLRNRMYWPFWYSCGMGYLSMWKSGIFVNDRNGFINVLLVHLEHFLLFLQAFSIN